MAKHYHVLDGLRGVAAMAVLAYHISARLELTVVLPRGYLAVDFFFALSGFVIGYAYENKLLQGMSFSNFALLRAIRLYPLLILGHCIGLLVALLKPEHLDELGAAFLIGLTALPSPFYQDPGHEIYWPLNHPAWSLFFELVANAAYGMVVRRLTTLRLVQIAILSGLVLLLGMISFNTLSVGYAPDHVLLGFPRVAFSFAVGLIIYRNKDRLALPIPGGFLTLSLLLLLAFSVPPEAIGWSMDVFFVFALTPLVIIACVQATESGSIEAICRISGRLSYPVYILQWPIIRVAGRVARDHVPVALWPVVCIATVLLVVAFAWVALKGFDEPARRYLGQSMLARVRVRNA